jgi:hypothetical protein
LRKLKSTNSEYGFEALKELIFYSLSRTLEVKMIENSFIVWEMIETIKTSKETYKIIHIKIVLLSELDGDIEFTISKNR